MMVVRTWARARRGFTLVEVLVVIAVVAVLISLLLPSLGRGREAGRGAACLSNLRSIGQATAMYVEQNREYYPLSSHTTGSLASPGAWLVTLEAHGAIPGVRRCPSDQHRLEKLTSYATNDHFEPLTPGIDYSPITGQTLPGGRKRALNRAGLIPRPFATVYGVEPEGDGTVDHIHSVGWTDAEQVGAALAVRRHNGAANYLYADGHGAPVTWARLSTTFGVDNNMFNPETAR